MGSSLLTPFLLNDFNPYQNRVWIIVCRKQAEENPEKSWLTVGIPMTYMTNPDPSKPSYLNVVPAPPLRNNKYIQRFRKYKQFKTCFQNVYMNVCTSACRTFPTSRSLLHLPRHHGQLGPANHTVAILVKLLEGFDHIFRRHDTLSRTGPTGPTLVPWWTSRLGGRHWLY